jgi:hypothetical protein
MQLQVVEKAYNQPMDTQKTITKSHSLQVESLSSDGKLQVKQKVKRPNYMLRLL